MRDEGRGRTSYLITHSSSLAARRRHDPELQCGGDGPQRRGQHRPALAGFAGPAAMPRGHHGDHRCGLWLHRPHHPHHRRVPAPRPAPPPHRPGGAAGQASGGERFSARGAGGHLRAGKRRYLPRPGLHRAPGGDVRGSAGGDDWGAKGARERPQRRGGLSFPPAPAYGARAVPGDPPPGRANCLPQGL